MIEICNVLLHRNGRAVLEIDSLDIQNGEILTIVGPNGAGKSTLLLALGLLIKPVRGEILFKGKSLVRWNELAYRRKISFVFQSPLLMDMTVEQNIALGLKFRSIPEAEIQARVGKWMKQLGIESLSKRRAGQLSGGEAQRVSLARAFGLEQESMLLDEPFSSLDPPARGKLLGDVSVLLADRQLTAVFVTHHLKEAAKLSHRMAVIVGGKLRQVGSVRQIKAHPEDEAVEAFLRELPQSR